MDNNKTGNLIRELRKEKNMTQKALADALHITDRAVSKWERGLCSPDISLLEPLSDILGVTVMELISGERNESQMEQNEIEIIEEKVIEVVNYSKKEVCEKKRFCKKVLSVAFLISLVPMLLNQYGGLKGVQEITGLINLFNPIGLISIILFIVGVWVPFKKTSTNKLIGLLGTIGIVVSEVYKYFTWHVMTITGEISIQNSINFAFPEFYIGLAVSVIMVFAYCVIYKTLEE